MESFQVYEWIRALSINGTMNAILLIAFLHAFPRVLSWQIGNIKIRMPALQMMERLHLDPITKISGEFTLPGSKSLSNRVLLLSAISKGDTLVENLLDSADIRYMVAALQQLKIPLVEDKVKMTARLVGNGGPINGAKEELFLGNAGTAMRPLAGVLCAGEGTFVLDGTPRMRERPIIDLVEGLQQVHVTAQMILNLGVTLVVAGSRRHV
jgi:5-enolpyruvylshikimate-3-phosphate synthase